MDTKARRSETRGAKNDGSAEPPLGQLLTAAREKLGVSRQEAAQRARLSLSYAEMLERESYKKVSDEIYLVPFLRRYANVLGLDGEDLAMRFVRDLQSIESEAARMAEPVMLETKRPGRRYSWAAIAVGAVAAIVLAKFGQSYYREQSPGASDHEHKRPASAPAPKAAREPAQAAAPAAQAPAGGQLAPSSPPSAFNLSADKRSAPQTAAPAAASGASSAPARTPARTGAPAAPAHAVSDPFANNDNQERPANSE